MISINSQFTLLMQPAESRPGGGTYMYHRTRLNLESHVIQDFSSHQEDMVMEKMLDDW